MTEEAVNGFRQLWAEKGWLEKDWPGKDGPGKDWRYGDESIAYEISCRLAERVYKKGKALEKRR